MESPSKLLLLLEAVRSIFEYGQSVVLNMPLQYISPKGDGHPVVIFPGLGTADGSTHFVRTFLANIGYTVYPWGFGRNLGPRDGLDKLTVELENRIRAISAAHGGAKVSLIGWSLGGIYAREIAKIAPDVVRQVITLGTPFKGDPLATNATMLYELLSKDKSHYNPAIIESIARCPDVPFTSIYSKTDGVVAWKCSLEVESDFAENIEVPGASHLGLGHNPISMHIIANRLSQPELEWHPYKH
jgi:triacylglycerol esterase/lipase EstA (alpha/beta hydrolase family)